MPPTRSIPRDTIDRMIQVVSSDWDLQEATAENRGHTAVYQVRVRTGAGDRRFVLKASPDGDSHGIDTEGRLLGFLDGRTSIPVPSVIAAVDDHDELPTPYVLMETLDGTALPYQETSAISDGALRRIARQTGEYLGELHGLDAVDAFGVLSYESPPTVVDSPPSVAVERFRVANEFMDWPAFLDASVGSELEKLEPSRFGDLVAEVRSTINAHLERLTGPYTPVLGRIDHGVHNLLIQPGDGHVEAVIDWGFTLAVTPGYDLKTVEYVLSGAVLAPLDEARDRRELVGDAMAAGYRETARYPREELVDAGSLYELMAIVRAMNHLEAGVAKVPAGSEDSVADGLRHDIGTLIR